MDNEFKLSSLLDSAVTFSTLDILLNMSIALTLGIILAIVYRATHKGEYYSQSFTLTIVFSAMIFSVVMIVIGSSLTRAFALVGALSVVRFQTVVKDTKDTIYIFAALVVGMASGIGQHTIALSATIFISIVAITLYKINFGARTKNDLTINVTVDDHQQAQPVVEFIHNNTTKPNLSLIKPFNHGKQLQLKYDIGLGPQQNVQEFANALSKLQGVSKVQLPRNQSQQNP